MIEKQYDSRQVEQKIQQLWEQRAVYAFDPHAPAIMSIDTPPPTVSGSLHIGHIFSYTQTDLSARYARMHGKEVFYPFGFDDNGLPTERFVEKKCGVTAHRMKRSEFIQLCLRETEGVEQAFKNLWQRMGLSVDWRASYATIDTMTRAISQASFVRLYHQGHVYRRNEPALYCTSCRTTVAQAELDDIEEQSVFYDIAFADSAGQQLVVATTRPELLSSCVALLFHPHDTRYQHLKGTQAVVPIFGNMVPVLADEQVVPEKGTGLVMCCTFGDTTDIAWYKKHDLPYRPSCGPDGKWLSSTGPLAGLKTMQAREMVVTLLQQSELVLGRRTISHTVNVHERCKQPIEFLVLAQWFLRVLPLKDQLIALADQITWYPDFMKTRYIDWVEHLKWDWCLSRQRFYGIPFPVWHCQVCQTIIPATEEQLPIDPQETPWQGPCPSCGAEAVVPDSDVMDTWNTSSLTPYICEALRTGTRDVFASDFTPMGMRPQAHDIIRTWAFYTMVKTWLHHGTVPWRDIVISGHVVTGSREKISKSQGNSMIQPEQLLERYSADAIRYWTASGALGYDTVFSEQQLKQGNRLTIKLWNAFRFIEEHGLFSAVATPVAPQQMIHRWMLDRLTACYERYKNYFAGYEAGLALEQLERCFWQDFCDNYLELIKDQCFHPERYAAEDVAETRALLVHIGYRFLQLYAPFIPYVTEELYQQLYVMHVGTSSLHRTQCADVQYSLRDEDAVRVMALVMDLVTRLRKLKTDQQLSLKTDIVSCTLYGTQAQLNDLADQKALIAGIARATEIRCTVGEGNDQLEQRGEEWHCSVRV